MRVLLYVCGQKSPRYSLGVAYLKSNCSSKGVNIKIATDSAQLQNCDLVALSTVAATIPDAIELLKELRPLKIPVVVGGPGALWDGFKDYDIQHIIVGEGEKALSKVISGTTERVIHEPNIDLATLKIPYRPPKKQIARYGILPKMIHAVSSRGCGFKCSFCTQRVWGSHRFHDAEFVIEDIKNALIQNPSAESVLFIDDLFIANHDRLVKLHKRWIENSFHKRLKINNVSIVPRLFNHDVAKILKEMNVIHVGLGIETFSPNLQKILNKYTTEEVAQNAINIAHESGLSVFCNFMYGVPEERISDLLPSMRFIKKNPNLTVNWFKFVAFPGCEVYKNGDPLKESMTFLPVKSVKGLLN